MWKIFQIFQRKSKNKHPKTSGVNYVCGKCGAQEIIPYEVLEDFDLMFPEELIHGPHMLRCEKCGSGIMQPEHYEAKIMGYGLYEGLDYTIKIDKQKKK